jgi:SAM-dependent methyltransferase
VAADLACGPGTNALAMGRLVPKVYAIDRNPVFLAEVRRRARAGRRRVVARAGDMRDFTLPGPVDLVTCFFDALNHLPRRRDLAPAFRAVHRALAPGGRFLFDVNTPYALRETWPKMKALWRGPGWFAVGRGVFFAGAPGRGGRPAPLSAGRGSFEIHWFFRDRRGLYRPRLELYEEITWTDAEIRAALKAAGFRGVRALADPALAPFRGDGGRGRRFYEAVRPG